MSGMFGSGTSTPQLSVIADPYAGVRSNLEKYINRGLTGNNPTYSGQRVAPLSGQEKDSLNWLQNYVSASVPKTTEAARKSVTDTLTGKFDPASSPFYQAVKAESARNLADTQANIASNAAGAGRYWSGGRLRAQGNAAVDNANNLNTVLGTLADQERTRQMQAVTQGMLLGQQESSEGLNKAEALQKYGGIERSLQQAINDAAYQEWMNVNYPSQANLMNSLQGAAPVYGQVQKDQSIFSKIAPFLGTAIGALLALPTGGMSVPIGAAIGGMGGSAAASL